MGLITRFLKDFVVLGKVGPFRIFLPFFMPRAYHSRQTARECSDISVKRSYKEKLTAWADMGPIILVLPNVLTYRISTSLRLPTSNSLNRNFGRNPIKYFLCDLCKWLTNASPKAKHYRLLLMTSITVPLQNY